MKNKNIIRLISLVFALLLCASTFVFAQTLPDEETEPEFNITSLNIESSYTSPIPLLLILINYDANGNGKNDFDPADSRKLYSDKTSEYYGEQWSYSTQKEWAERGFGKNDSIASFYYEMTEGHFTFTPCPETYQDLNNGGVKNDGVIEVTVPYKHPQAATGTDSGEDANSRKAILREAAKYVDFKSLDKDNNGKLSASELAIVYICPGQESSSAGSFDDSKHFGVHGHYTGGAGIIIDGVTVGAAGFVRVGEYTSKSSISTVGLFTHELGHFLGAPDLYDTTSSSSKWNYVGYMSLMASGSWSSYNGLNGAGASYMDPWDMQRCGLYDYTIVTEDGEYTLYNRQASQPYNILKVYTPNPDEYYLIENRYVNPSMTHYDRISSTNHGIIIWHIDESVCRGGKPNSKGNGGAIIHEPGVTILSKTQLSPNYCAFNKGDVFDSDYSGYKFPLSGTSYTLLTEEEAASFNLKITVLTSAANEMKIKIEGAISAAPEGVVTTSDISTTTALITGKITELNNGNCTKAGFIVSKNSNPTIENGTKYACQPDESGKFTLQLLDLEPNTKYFVKMYLTGNNGTSEKINVFYTDSIKKERTDYYVVFMYKGITDVERSYEVKVKPGETLKYNFPMTKRGYTFCGWYKDAEYTELYDMGFTQTKCDDFSLYGKWVTDDNVATLRLEGAESKYLYFPCEVGTTFGYVTPKERDGYTFAGWYLDEERTIEADFDQIIPDAIEYVIYAKWDKETTPDPVTETTAVTTETTTTVQTETTIETTTTPISTTNGGSGENQSGSIITLVIIAGVGLVVLVVVVLLITRKKKKKE